MRPFLLTTKWCTTSSVMQSHSSCKHVSSCSATQGGLLYFLGSSNLFGSKGRKLSYRYSGFILFWALFYFIKGEEQFCTKSSVSDSDMQPLTMYSVILDAICHIRKRNQRMSSGGHRVILEVLSIWRISLKSSKIQRSWRNNILHWP